MPSRAALRLSALLAISTIGRSARRTACAKCRSRRRDAGARVDDEQDRVAVGERGLGLGAHPAGERGGIALLQAGGVDDGEFEVAEPRFALATVARHAGRIVDQRELAADEPVEQRRLARRWDGR